MSIGSSLADSRSDTCRSSKRCWDNLGEAINVTQCRSCFCNGPYSRKFRAVQIAHSPTVAEASKRAFMPIILAAASLPLQVTAMAVMVIALAVCVAARGATVALTMGPWCLACFEVGGSRQLTCRGSMRPLVKPGAIENVVPVGIALRADKRSSGLSTSAVGHL